MKGLRKKDKGKSIEIKDKGIRIKKKGLRKKEEGRSIEEIRSLIKNFNFFTLSFILQPLSLLNRR